jgi:DNA-binding response OmpR family regulator
MSAVARIRAVSRRHGSAGDSAGPAGREPEPPLQVGALRIDVRARRAWLDGDEVKLTAKEFDLLAHLATEPGVVHRRADIIDNLWDPQWYGPTKTLDAHVAALRRKHGDARRIEAVRGVGFRLEPPT